MAIVAELEERQGLHWTLRNGSDRYVVIVNKHDKFIETVDVRPLLSYNRCYDDRDAVKVLHRDNVRLRADPGPFGEVCEQSDTDGECYAYADLNSLTRLNDQDLERLGVEVLDGGKQISVRERDEILDHPWRDVAEKQLPRRPADGGASKDTQAAGEDWRAVIERKAREKRRLQSEKDAEELTVQGSGELRKALAKPGLPDLDGKTGPGKTGPGGPNGPGE